MAEPESPRYTPEFPYGQVLVDGQPWEEGVLIYGPEVVEGRPSWVHDPAYPIRGEPMTYMTMSVGGVPHRIEVRGLTLPVDATHEEKAAMYDYLATREVDPYDSYVDWTRRIARVAIEMVLSPEEIADAEILEICSGTGNTTLGLIDARADPRKIEAIDISEGMMSVAQAKPELERVNFRLGDISEIELTPNSKRVAVAILGLFNVDRALWEQTVDNILGSLEEGGKLVVVDSPHNSRPPVELAIFLREKYGGETTELEHDMGNGPFNLMYTIVPKTRPRSIGRVAALSV